MEPVLIDFLTIPHNSTVVTGRRKWEHFLQQDTARRNQWENAAWIWDATGARAGTVNALLESLHLRSDALKESRVTPPAT